LMVRFLVSASFTGSASKTTPLNELLATTADACLIRVHAVKAHRGDGKEACGHSRHESPEWKNLNVSSTGVSVFSLLVPFLSYPSDLRLRAWEI
jgi:hypothetical protein